MRYFSLFSGIEAAMRDGVPGLEPDRRCGTCRW